MAKRYYKSSTIDFINKLTKEDDYIALNGYLKLTTAYEDKDFRGRVLVCHKNYERMYWFEYCFYSDYCTISRYNLTRGKTRIQMEILENWDAIIADTYVSSVIKAEEKRKEAEKKKRIAEEKKAAREAQRISDCKTFYADFFERDFSEDNCYLKAIWEIGERLQDGEYSNLVLNDKIMIKFRTKSKRKDLPFTIEVCDIRTFTVDTKYGDLWEDIDDLIETYILNALVDASYSKHYDIEQLFKNLEWLEMYANKKKDKYCDNERVVKAVDMLLSSIKRYAYTENGNYYKTNLTWNDKKFIVETMLSY